METNYHDGYKHALLNAKKHFEAANILADSKIFSIANSLLILSAEELLKASMLFCKHSEPSIQIDDFNEYFKNHKFKHKAFLGLNFWGNLMEQMMNLSTGPAMKRFEEKGDFLDKEEVIATRNEGMQNMMQWLKDVASKAESLEFNEQWWQQADNAKQNGFYVSLNEKNAQWITPDKITEKQFLHSKKIVFDLLQRYSSMEEIHAMPEIQEMIQEMKGKGMFS